MFYSTETAKRRITETTPHDSPVSSDFTFRTPKISAKLKRDHPKCRCGRLNVAEVAENYWQLSTRIVFNLSRWQVCHAFAVLQCVAWGMSATADPCNYYLLSEQLTDNTVVLIWVVSLRWHFRKKHIITGSILAARLLNRIVDALQSVIISSVDKQHNIVIFGGPLQVAVALCYGTVVLSVLSVCNVGILWQNSWMDQDATWYRGRPRSRRQCVRCGPSSPREWDTTAISPLFGPYRPMSIAVKRLDESGYHLVLR